MASRAAISLSGTAKGQVALLVAAGVSLACGILISIIAARASGNAEFGFFALIATLLPIARDVTDLGTANVTARRIAADPDSEADALGELFAWRWIPAVAAATALGLLAATADGNAHRLVLISAALCAFLYVNSGYVAFFQVRLQMAVPALITIVTQVATVALCALLALASAPPIAYPLVILVREATSMLLLRLAAVELSGCQPTSIKLQPKRLMSGAVTSVALAALAYQLAVGCGPLLLDLLSTPAQLGWYGAAFRLTAPLFALAWIVATPLVPKLTEAAAKRSYSQTVQQWVEFPILLAAVAAGALYATAPIAVDLLFGPDFEPAAPVLQLLAIAAAANTVGALMVTALIAAGGTRTIGILGGLTLLLVVGISVVVVPAGGAAGAATALLAGSVVTAAVASGMTVGIARSFAIVGKAILIALGIALVTAITPFTGIAQLLSCGIIAAAVGALLFWRSYA